MADITDRLAFPLLAAGQSQKEITHNEALLRADMLVQSVVMRADLATPPASPADGQCWIVGREATGVWTGRDGALAYWSASGWQFAPPFEGLAVWNRATGRQHRFTNGAWDDSLEAARLRIGGRQVVGAQQPAITLPSGGLNPDGQARQAISDIVSALQAHGLISY